MARMLPMTASPPPATTALATRSTVWRRREAPTEKKARAGWVGAVVTATS